jgi:UDP:flavonoid glycosyltransferase YjiC (YdhE family)
VILAGVRVLFTTTGHSGHVLPLAPLAHACLRAGHDVAVAIHAPRAAAAERLGLTALSVEVAPDEAWAPLMSRIPELMQREADSLIISEGFARIGAGGALPGVIRAVQEWRPDVVVHECYEFAGPIAAERLRIPSVRVALGLASTEDWVTRLAAPAVADLRRSQGLAPVPEPEPLLSMLPERFDDGPAERRFGDRPAASAPPPLPAWWEPNSSAEPHPSPGNAGPLVYLTFGSVTGSLPFFPALYRQALEALAQSPVRVLLTLGRDADPARLGQLPPNVHAEAWVVQDDVLPHAAVVVGHGGYGTTLGALAHGVPMVSLPLFAGDQWRTARRVADVGAGVVLDDGERRVFDLPGPEVVARLPGAVRDVLADARFRLRARGIAEEIAALPPADDAIAALEAAAFTPMR